MPACTVPLLHSRPAFAQLQSPRPRTDNKNYPELINALLKIESDLHDACATDELIAIIDRMEQKIKDKTILTDIVAKILKIGLHIYRAIKIGAITFENIGDVLGRLIFTMLSDKCPE